MSKTYVCERHPNAGERESWCPLCKAAFNERKSAHNMTGDERAEELRWWGNQLTLPFSDLHQRYEELVGRPIWTHEFAGREAVDRLIEEARAQC